MKNSLIIKIIGLFILFFIVMIVLYFFIMKDIDFLGQGIDDFLRINYQNIAACQGVKEAAGEIEKGVLFLFFAKEREGQSLVEEALNKFPKFLQTLSVNITVEGDRKKVKELDGLFERIKSELQLLDQSSLLLQAENRQSYFNNLDPLLARVNSLSLEIGEINKGHLREINSLARIRSRDALDYLRLGLLICMLYTVFLCFFIYREVVAPVKKLIASINETRNGDLDVVLKSKAKNELNQLTGALNSLLAELQSKYKVYKKRLLRIRQSTEEIFKILHDNVAIIDLEGRVELSTVGMELFFNVKSGINVNLEGFEWLNRLFKQILEVQDRNEVRHTGALIHRTVGCREYVFKPMLIPICVGTVASKELAGVAFIFKDVTWIKSLPESPEEIFPAFFVRFMSRLASIRMSLHLLLKDDISEVFNEGQKDLFISAQEECLRLEEDLAAILESGNT